MFKFTKKEKILSERGLEATTWQNGKLIKSIIIFYSIENNFPKCVICDKHPEIEFYELKTCRPFHREYSLYCECGNRCATAFGKDNLRAQWDSLIERDKERSK
jgi:hypothetical protein